MHTHQAHEGASKSIAQANKEHFAKTAEDEVDPRWRKYAKDSAEMMTKVYGFNKEETTALDFACGIGLFSRSLHPFVKTIVGVDNAAPAVDRYNREAREAGIAEAELRAIACELKANSDQLNGLKFDVVTCSASFHHFSDVAEKMTILVSHLKPGGVLLVVDSIEDGSIEIPDEYKPFVVRLGFTEEDMRRFFEDAGLLDFKFVKGARVQATDTINVELFVATGKKTN